MRLFIAGQKEFGRAVFELARRLGHEVVGVSAPPFGRNLGTTGEAPMDRLRAAGDAGVPWMPAGTLRADTLPDGVELILAAHSHDFIGRKTRAGAELGAIGYHPSLLPLHRGRDAVRWALRMGDRVTGGSIYWLSDTMDGGPIAAREMCFVRPGDTPDLIWRRDLLPIGIRLFRRVLEDISGGVLVKIPQEEDLATWEPSWSRPPVARPDLPQLCDGRVSRYVTVADPDRASNR